MNTIKNPMTVLRPSGFGMPSCGHLAVVESAHDYVGEVSARGGAVDAGFGGALEAARARTADAIGMSTVKFTGPRAWSPSTG